jgi:hypothetical protein
MRGGAWLSPRRPKRVGTRWRSKCDSLSRGHAISPNAMICNRVSVQPARKRCMRTSRSRPRRCDSASLPLSLTNVRGGALTPRFGSPFDHDPEHPQDGAHQAAEEQPIVLWDGRSSGEVRNNRHHRVSILTNSSSSLPAMLLLLSPPVRHRTENPSIA